MTENQSTPQIPDHWSEDEAGLHTTITFRKWRRAWDFVGVIKDKADAADHHPDLQLSFNTLTITLISHDAGEVTERDYDMALQIQKALAEEDITEQVSDGPTLGG